MSNVQEVKMNGSKYFLSIDGVIGAGKSTIINKYREMYPNIMFILEPIDVWMKSGLLTKFYEDQKRYAFDLQCFIMDSFTNQLEEAFKDQRRVIVMERSHLACFTIFSYLHWKNGLLTDEQYKAMEEKWYAYDRDLRSRGYFLDHVFLDTPLDVAMERIKIRGRGNEAESVSQTYQQEFIDRYQELCLTPYTAEQLDDLMSKLNGLVTP